MLIGHVGFYVRDIIKVDDILIQIFGFTRTYNEMEMFNNKIRNIRKYIYKGIKIELIDDENVPNNMYHICFKSKVPKFLSDKYFVVPGNPFDKSVLLDFVYINDSIYFEFVRNKE